jgi:hypothetical protein
VGIYPVYIYSIYLCLFSRSFESIFWSTLLSAPSLPILSECALGGFSSNSSSSNYDSQVRHFTDSRETSFIGDGLANEVFGDQLIGKSENVS